MRLFGDRARFAVAVEPLRPEAPAALQFVGFELWIGGDLIASAPEVLATLLIGQLTLFVDNWRGAQLPSCELPPVVAFHLMRAMLFYDNEFLTPAECRSMSRQAARCALLPRLPPFDGADAFLLGGEGQKDRIVYSTEVGQGVREVVVSRSEVGAVIEQLARSHAPFASWSAAGKLE